MIPQIRKDLKQLRADPSIADIPVVVISADVLDEHTASLLELGVNDCLSKPFDLDDFDEIVDRYLETGKDS